jgi:ribosomal protein L22
MSEEYLRTEVKAVARYIRISPQKARLVADQVRGKDVEEALDALSQQLVFTQALDIVLAFGIPT